MRKLGSFLDLIMARWPLFREVTAVEDGNSTPMPKLRGRLLRSEISVTEGLTWSTFQVSWLEHIAMSRFWGPEHSELTLVSSFQDKEREKSSKLLKIKILGQELTLLCCLRVCCCFQQATEIVLCSEPPPLLLTSRVDSLTTWNSRPQFIFGEMETVELITILKLNIQCNIYFKSALITVSYFSSVYCRHECHW